MVLADASCYWTQILPRVAFMYILFYESQKQWGKHNKGSDLYSVQRPAKPDPRYLRINVRS